MHKMTEDNLQSAFAGESQAHMKYLIFADKAESEGKYNIARLFRAVAYAERVHATNHLRVLDKLGDTAKNLEVAIAGEDFEVEEMYPAYYQEALEQGEKAEEKTIHYALEAEKIHRKMYCDAKEAVTGDTDMQLGPVNICPICGYTVENDKPDHCPVCGAKSEVFEKF